MNATRVALALSMALAAPACGDERGGEAAPGPVAALTVRGVDAASGQRLPGCRMALTGLHDTPSPAWSAGAVDPEVGREFSPTVLGVGHRILAAPCEARVDVAVGRYQVRLTRGIEWQSAEVDVEVTPSGGTAELSLPRAVETPGVACADLHVHSSASFDSRIPPTQRIVSAMAEGLDAIAPTDHDAVDDWNTAQASLGIGAEAPVLLMGDELTPDQWPVPSLIGHFSLFPVPADFEPADLILAGATAGELLTAARAAAPEGLIQVNHPRWNASIGYLEAIGFDPEAGTGTTEPLFPGFDLLEIWNAHELDRMGGAATDMVFEDWFSLLRMGLRVFATGSTDTHWLTKTPLGFPRTCVDVGNDVPGSIGVDDLRDGLGSGQAFVTSGPFLRATVDGAGPGALVAASAGMVELHVAVDAASFVPVDRFTVFVDGEPAFQGDIPVVPVQEMVPLSVAGDAFIVVRVDGDMPLGPEAGDHAMPLPSLAFTNPIFIDADGDGAWTPP